MKSLEAFYQSDLLPDLEKLEAQRLTVKKKFVQAILIVAGLNLAFLFIAGRFGVNVMFMFMFLVVSAFLLFFHGTLNITGFIKQASRRPSFQGSWLLSINTCGTTKQAWCPWKSSWPAICLTTSPETIMVTIW